MKFRSCPNKCPQSFIIIDWFQSRCKNNNLYTKAAINLFFIKSKNIQTSLLILIYINRWKSKKMQYYSIWLIMLFCHYIITNTVHASFKFQQSISNLIFFTTMMMAIKCLKSAFNACAHHSQHQFWWLLNYFWCENFCWWNYLVRNISKFAFIFEIRKSK